MQSKLLMMHWEDSIVFPCINLWQPQPSPPVKTQEPDLVSMKMNQGLWREVGVSEWKLESTWGIGAPDADGSVSDGNGKIGTREGNSQSWPHVQMPLSWSSAAAYMPEEDELKWNA